jgi:hypothetical protein
LIGSYAKTVKDRLRPSRATWLDPSIPTAGRAQHPEPYRPTSSSGQTRSPPATHTVSSGSGSQARTGFAACKSSPRRLSGIFTFVAPGPAWHSVRQSRGVPPIGAGQHALDRHRRPLTVKQARRQTRLHLPAAHHRDRRWIGYVVVCGGSRLEDGCAESSLGDRLPPRRPPWPDSCANCRIKTCVRLAGAEEPARRAGAAPRTAAAADRPGS